jgi:hypothetical protein
MTHFYYSMYLTKYMETYYEGVSKSFRTVRLGRELQMVQLSATRCSHIAILWISLVSFATITLCVASQRVIPKVSLYFVIDSVRKLFDTSSYVPPCSVMSSVLIIEVKTLCSVARVLPLGSVSSRFVSVTTRTSRLIRYTKSKSSIFHTGVIFTLL